MIKIPNGNNDQQQRRTGNTAVLEGLPSSIKQLSAEGTLSTTLEMKIKSTHVVCAARKRIEGQIGIRGT